ncbi:MAG: deaminase [Candidatus Dormiibacterota bacterium]
MTPSAALWLSLDPAWQEAFRQAWEAFRTGNIPVGACVTTADGKIVRAARNRVSDEQAPEGEVFGSSVAHAEVNVLARIALDTPRELVLTTTLEPCLQCSAVARLGAVATIRFAGADPLWDGCHDFSSLSPREAARPQLTMDGPRADQLGLFATLISRFWRHSDTTEAFLRAAGEGHSLELVQDLRATGQMARLAAMEVDDALAHLWPQLSALRKSA